MIRVLLADDQELVRDGFAMILDAQADIEYVYDALRAGANGFLLKDVPRAALIGAVRTVSSGDALLSPAVTKKLIERYVSIPLHPEPRRSSPT